MSENRLNEGRFVPDSSKNVELKPKLSPTLTHYFEPPCCLEAEINATRVCGLLLREPFQPTDSRARCSCSFSGCLTAPWWWAAVDSSSGPEFTALTEASA